MGVGWWGALGAKGVRPVQRRADLGEDYEGGRSGLCSLWTRQTLMKETEARF